MRRYGKSYRTKKIRHFRILRNKFFWFGFLIAAAVTGLIYLFVFSSVFKIKDIQVSGYESAAVKDIISNSAKNIFFVNLDEIRQKSLEQYPKIKEVSLKRKFPDKIVAEVEEKKPAAAIFMVSSEEEYFLIDDQGIAFEKSPNRPDLPVIELDCFQFDLGQQVVKKEVLDDILNINSKFKDLDISDFFLVSDKRLNVKTAEGWEIYFNLKGDLNWQTEELSILLKEKIPSDKRKNLEYIDLRFDRVYIFPDTYLED